jgi:hypothetical protein
MRLAGQDIVGRAACDALLVERAVHPLDDVVALAEFAQRRFRLFGDDPLTGADGLGEAEVFEVAQASDLLRQVCVRLPVR